MNCVGIDVSKGKSMIVVMTFGRNGDSTLEDRIEGLNAGADYYLTKPFDSRELLE